MLYVLDEPSAGLHPADSQALYDALDRLRDGGNSVFVVEHDLELMRRAQWLVDVGPQAGEHGGRVLYSGEPDGLRRIEDSRTARYLFDQVPAPASRERSADRWLELKGIHRHNLQGVDAQLPLGVLTAVTGISGSGKSSLMAQALPELMLLHLGHEPVDDSADSTPEDGPTVIEATRASLPEPWTPSSAWCRWTRNRSAARHAPTWPPIPACSITCASCSPRPRRATPPLRCRSLLVQRGQGPVRDLRRRGFRQRGTAVHARVYAPCPPAMAPATTRPR